MTQEEKKKFKFWQFKREDLVAFVGFLFGYYIATTRVPDAPWEVNLLLFMGGMPLVRLALLIVYDIPRGFIQIVREAKNPTEKMENLDDV